MRVNAFLTAQNDAGRTVTLGGRKKSDKIWVTLNTDNAHASDVSMKVTVSGGQKSRFDITLPDLSEDVEIFINGRRFDGQRFLPQNPITY